MLAHHVEKALVICFLALGVYVALPPFAIGFSKRFQILKLDATLCQIGVINMLARLDAYVAQGLDGDGGKI